MSYQLLALILRWKINAKSCDCSRRLAIAGAVGGRMRPRTQTSGDEAAKNAQQARAALDAMVQAMGGQAWLNMKNRMIEGHVSPRFSRAIPTWARHENYEFHQWPDHDRIEVTKHRDVVEFYIGREGWEVTYRGKKAMDKESWTTICAGATTPLRPR